MEPYGEILKQVGEIPATPVRPDALNAISSEQDFVGLSVDLLVEAASIVCVAACILPPTGSWSRNQAIVGGNVVRLYKLLSALLDQTCQHRRETTFIFSRLAFENIVNIRYLIRCSSNDLFDSYVRYSLQHEVHLLSRIEKNISERGNLELPIERRMIASIQTTEQRSEISLNEVGKQKNWGGKNLYERCREVDLDEAYIAAFGGPSHSVHGNWVDLLEYHVACDDGTFAPNLEWHSPRPQPLFVLALLSVETVALYLEFISEGLWERLESRLGDLRNRILVVDRAHESFLNRISGTRGQANP